MLILELDSEILNQNTLIINVQTSIEEELIEKENKLGLSAKLQTIETDGYFDYAKTSDSRILELKEVKEILIDIVNHPLEIEEEKVEEIIKKIPVIEVQNLNEDNMAIQGAVYLISEAETFRPLWYKTTNFAGYARFDKLEPGKYILEEVETPEGMVSAGFKFYIEISESGEITYTAMRVENLEVVELTPEAYEEQIIEEKAQVKQKALSQERAEIDKLIETFELNSLEANLKRAMQPKLDLEKIYNTENKELEDSILRRKIEEKLNEEDHLEIQDEEESLFGKILKSIILSTTDALVENQTQTNPDQIIDILTNNTGQTTGEEEVTEIISGVEEAQTTTGEEISQTTSDQDIIQNEITESQKALEEKKITEDNEVIQETFTEENKVIKEIFVEEYVAIPTFSMLFKNKRSQPVDFTFKKVDDSNTGLGGATFSLLGYTTDGNGQGQTTYVTKTSDTEGIVTFENLPRNSYYYLKEESTVSGYNLPNNIWIVHIQEDSTIKIYKTDSLIPIVSFGPHPFLAGAWAKMNAVKDKYVNVETGAEQDLDAVSGATIKPEDLNICSSWATDPALGVTDVTPVDGDFAISNTKADLTVYKKDPNGNLLDGAVFTLIPTNPTGTAITGTSAGGQVTFNGLADGVYELEETQAPTGYTVSTDKWQVTVSGGNISVERLGVPITYAANLAASTNKQIKMSNPSTYNATYPSYGYYYAVKISSEIISVDTTNKTFEQKIVFNVDKTYTKSTSLKLTSNTNTNITNATSSFSGFAYDPNTKTITIGDSTTFKQSSVTITVKGTYNDQSDISVTTTHTGSGLYRSGNQWFWSNNNVFTSGTLTSTVPITVVGDPIQVVPGNGILATAVYSDNISSGMQIGTKITQINRQAGTFEALIYFNRNNATCYYHDTTLTFDGATNSSISSIDSITKYQLAGTYNQSTYMPENFVVDLTDTSKYGSGQEQTYTNTNSVAYPVQAAGTVSYARYVFKVTGKYDKTLADEINLNTIFNGKVYRPNNYFQATGNAAYSIVPSEWSSDPSIGEVNGKPTITVTNTPKAGKGKFTLKKKGAEEALLQGVVFKLRGPVTDSDPGVEVTATTNAGGELIFENLAEGIYFLTEVTPYEGYIKKDEIWRVVVDEDGNTSIVPGGTLVTPPPTNSNTTFPYYNGTLNSQTQVSSPTDQQLQTPYPIYSNPISYTTAMDGEYATDFDQTTMAPNDVQTLRNAWLEVDPVNPATNQNYGGYLTYEGNYQTLFDEQNQWKTIDFAHVAKYAEKKSPETPEDHQYKVTLKVKGNTVMEKTRDKLGVIILLDNSRSMETVVPGTGQQRVTLAKNATSQFVDNLKGKLDNTEFALVTYGSAIFDGSRRTTYYLEPGQTSDIHTGYMGNYSYLSDFTGDITQIKNKLPSQVPQQNEGQFWYFGGTYTGGAFLEAEKLVKLADERLENKFDRLVVVNITDGVPTISPVVDKVYTNDKGQQVADFSPKDLTPVGTTPERINIQGDGRWYVMKPHNLINNNTYANKPYHVGYTPDGYSFIGNHGIPVVLASQNLKNLGAEVYNIGIAVQHYPGEIEEDETKQLMEDISSGGLEYNYDLQDAHQLTDAFDSIVNSITRDTIQGGIVTDPMGEKVDLVYTENFNDPNVQGNYTLKGYKNGVQDDSLVAGVTPTYDPTTRTIKLNGLNLGKDEEVVFDYTVKLRTEGQDAAADNVYYFTNKETTLEPNPAKAQNVKWNFPVPSVRKPGPNPPSYTNLPVENYLKPDIGFIKIEKDSYGETPVALRNAKFQLYKGVESARVKVGEEVTSDSDGKLLFENLDPGSYQLVETREPPGYKPLDDPAVTFEVTTQGEIANIDGVLANAQGPIQSPSPEEYYYIENQPYPDMDLVLAKLDGSYDPIPSGSVTFTLTKPSSNTTGGDVPADLATRTVDLANPGALLTMEIPYSMNGEYILEESSAPTGYIKSFDKYHIEIDQDNRTIQLTSVTNTQGTQVTYKYKDAGGTIVEHDFAQSGTITLYSESGGISSTIQLGIVNIQPVYPATGGMGTLAFTIVGGAVMTGSIIEMKRKRRRGENDEE